MDATQKKFFVLFFIFIDCHPELDSGSGFRVKPGMTKDEEFIFY